MCRASIHRAAGLLAGFTPMRHAERSSASTGGRGWRFVALSYPVATLTDNSEIDEHATRNVLARELTHARSLIEERLLLRTRRELQRMGLVDFPQSVPGGTGAIVNRDSDRPTARVMTFGTVRS
jgi:hypothetical protein